MTGKDKDGLMDLISNLNFCNKEHGVSYLCSVGLLREDSGDYFLSLRFDTLIYSPDFFDIMSWCVEHTVLCSINHYHDYSVLFFY